MSIINSGFTILGAHPLENKAYFKTYNDMFYATSNNVCDAEKALDVENLLKEYYYGQTLHLSDGSLYYVSPQYNGSLSCKIKLATQSAWPKVYATVSIPTIGYTKSYIPYLSTLTDDDVTYILSWNEYEHPFFNYIAISFPGQAGVTEYDVALEPFSEGIETNYYTPTGKSLNALPINAGGGASVLGSVSVSTISFKDGSTTTTYNGKAAIEIDYVSPTTLTSTLSSYVTSAALSETLSGYVTSAALSATLSSYFKTADFNSTLNSALEQYESDVKIEDLATVASVSTLSNNLSQNYYTKTQTEDLVSGKVKSYVVHGDTDPAFKSNNARIEVSGFTDYSGGSGKSIAASDLHIGDIVLLSDADYPDRWVAEFQNSTTIVLMTLETQKVVVPTEYIKDASVSGNTLTLTKSNSSSISFSVDLSGYVMKSTEHIYPSSWDSLDEE